MKVYRPIKLKEIQNRGDVLVPISFKCRTCKKQTKAIFIDVFLQEIYGAKLDCFNCGTYWTDVMDPLGSEDRNGKVLRISLTI